MNIYKGLLFLHGHVNPANFSDFIDAQARYHYGASTAAEELAPPLGNRAASRRWFGRDAKSITHPSQAGCIAGGCG